MPSPLRLTVRRGPAPGAGAESTRVSVRLPSDTACVEEAIELVALHCFSGHPVGAHTVFRFRVALAEALANAIICGNAQDGGKSVLIEATLGPDSILLGVTDEGPGFDPAEIPEPLRPADLERTCGRGLFLIRKLTDEVRFNDRGNTIWMTLRRQ